MTTMSPFANADSRRLPGATMSYPRYQAGLPFGASLAHAPRFGIRPIYPLSADRPIAASAARWAHQRAAQRRLAGSLD